MYSLVPVQFFLPLFLLMRMHKTYKKVAEGIIVNLQWKSTQDTPLLQVKVTSDKIIRITATPENSFFTAKTKALTTNPIL
ncbi:hypothetical protein SAMN05428975_1469 [Mucilaginibacter sp. OK268]|nr:hypothetical protein SAMN05428975_1469 [Mucilaginibacter sp. OK268]